MKIYFKVEELPRGKEEYRLGTDIEGKLVVEVNGEVLFDENGILLVEFAVVLKKWLKEVSTYGGSEMYYASMDFDEEPILCFRYICKDSLFKICSIWGKDIANPQITLTDAQEGVEDYIERLKTELKSDHSISIDGYQGL